MAAEHFDLICFGAGPAGQKAAIQAAKAGFRAAVIERDARIGGACLLTGTIPSKALREQALRFSRIHKHASAMSVKIDGAAPLSALLSGVDGVVAAQDRYLRNQMTRNRVHLYRGRGWIESPGQVCVEGLDGSRTELTAAHVLIATGSRPRHVPSVPVDHEHILDSDSILTLSYLPRSMIVLGSGVIACEYASIFAALGTQVTLADKAAEPLGFLDVQLRQSFLRAFTQAGGVYRGGVDVAGAAFDGVASVEVELAQGDTLSGDIVLAAMGRIANIEGLGLDRLGVAMTPRGHVQVNAQFATTAAGIYAAGDVIGPPALACAAADQGRQAARAALGLPSSGIAELIPTGVYTIPEIACVGLTPAEAQRRNIDIVIGSADFAEVARAHIAGNEAGLLQLICERDSSRVLGVQIVGEGATDLVHLGQAAIASGATVNFFIEQVFNFPTMTESYRIAAFDAIKQLAGVAAGMPGLPCVPAARGAA
jgi:NAD(P) transhydrogenase